MQKNIIYLTDRVAKPKLSLLKIGDLNGGEKYDIFDPFDIQLKLDPLNPNFVFIFYVRYDEYIKLKYKDSWDVNITKRTEILVPVQPSIYNTKITYDKDVDEFIDRLIMPENKEDRQVALNTILYHLLQLDIKTHNLEKTFLEIFLEKTSIGKKDEIKELKDFQFSKSYQGYLYPQQARFNILYDDPDGLVDDQKLFIPEHNKMSGVKYKNGKWKICTWLTKYNTQNLSFVSGSNTDLLSCWS